MPTVLCLDDFTCGLAEAAQMLRESRYEVLPADDNTIALELAAERPLDAIILNCHRERNNADLVTALRILQPHAAMVMFSGYCGCRAISSSSRMSVFRRETRGGRFCRCCGRLCVRAVTDFAVPLLREMTRGFPEVQLCRDGRTSGGRRGLRRFRAGRHAGVGGRNLSRHALAGLRAT